MSDSTTTQPDIRLDLFSNPGFSRGASRRKEMLWSAVSGLLVASWLPGETWRCRLLRLFGAEIGDHVILKPRLRVRYPWKLQLGDHVWIGENVWFDNFDRVEIASHCCVSQGAYLCTSTHDWSDPRFGFRMSPIRLETGAWVGANATLAPGTVMRRGAVVTLGGVAHGALEAHTIYGGNPAVPQEARTLSDPDVAD